MASKPNRYREMERYMTCALIADTIIFIFYLVFAGLGIIWLKALFVLAGLGLSGALLWFLYTTKELLRQRSLWITAGAAAIALCIFISLILNFPSPNKYKQPVEQTACETIETL